MKINIKDISLFENYVSAINQLVPHCKFEINSDGCEVRGINESVVMRAYYTTNNITSAEPMSFCFAKLSSLLSSLKIIKEFELKDKKNDGIILDFDGTFIKYNGQTKFKYTTIKEEIIEKSISPRLKTDLVETFGFTLTNTLLKKLSSLSFVSNSDNTKLYLYKDNNYIYGEVDDKQSKIADSLAIPISNDFFGGWETPLIVKMDSFRMWNLLNSESIKIAFTDKNVLQIMNEIKTTTNIFTNIKIISSVLKN